MTTGSKSHAPCVARASYAGSLMSLATTGPWDKVPSVWRSMYSTAAYRHAQALLHDTGLPDARRAGAAMKVVDLGLMMGSALPHHKAFIHSRRTDLEPNLASRAALTVPVWAGSPAGSGGPPRRILLYPRVRRCLGPKA